MAYLYIEPTLQSWGIIEDDRPAEFTERHHFRLPVVSLKAAGRLEREIDTHAVSGVILGLHGGLPSRRQLLIVRHGIRRGLRAFLYWPAENAIEVVDRERLSSLWRHWFANNAWLWRRRTFVFRRQALLECAVAAGVHSAGYARRARRCGK